MLLTDYYSIEELKDIRKNLRITKSASWIRQPTILLNNVLKDIFNLTPLQFCKIIDYLIKTGDFKKCIVCNKDTYRFRVGTFWLDSCSKPCQLILKTKQTRETCLEKYGVTHHLKTEQSKNKFKQTCLEKFGAEHHLKTKQGVEKHRETIQRLYGVDCNSQLQTNKEKVRESWNIKTSEEIKISVNRNKHTQLKRYGVTSFMSTLQGKEKHKNTLMKNYGVEHPSKHTDIFERMQRNGKLRKQYQLGTTEIKIQGYEPQALDILLHQENISPKDIAYDKSTGKPTILYTFESEVRTFYPDFYIKSQNRIIEVKSTWTYKKDLQKNLAKQQACIEQGYNFDFYIIDSKGKRVIYLSGQH